MNISKKNILSDDNLENVSGGFKLETGYFNAGAEIVCPNCGNADRSKFKAIESIATQEGEYFKCSCGQQFYRFPNGSIEADI